MLKTEEKVVEFLKKYYLWVFGIIMTILAVWTRVNVRNYLSGDMDVYLLKWYDQMVEGGGLKALSSQIGTYGMTYQIYIALMTYIPLNPITMYKGLSILFDFLLAIMVGVVISDFSTDYKKEKAVLAYTITLFLPTVFINSAVWGQCDSIYSFFCLFTLYLLRKNRAILAFIIFGIAIAFKLQALFILPFILMYYVIEKKFSIFSILLSLVSFYVMCVPGIIAGRGLLDPFLTYVDQKGTFPVAYFNFPSALVIFGDGDLAYEVISKVMILATIAFLGIEFYYLLLKKVSLEQPKVYFAVAAWSLWTCVLFLPEMHDRYAFLMEILLLIVCFYEKKVIFVFLPAIIASVTTYSCFLFGVAYNMKLLSAIYVISFVVYSVFVINMSNQADIESRKLPF